MRRDMKPLTLREVAREQALKVGIGSASHGVGLILPASIIKLALAAATASATLQ